MENLYDDFNELDLNDDSFYTDDSTKMFLKELENYPKLDRDVQKKLLNEYYETKDENLLNKLVKHNLRLTVFVAKKYLKNCANMTLLDLIQENSLTLIKSVKEFNPHLGYQFSTYAINAMENNLFRQIDNKDKTIRKPVYIERLNSLLTNYKMEYFQKYNKYPSDKEVKKALDISDKTYAILKDYEKLKPQSLNITIDEKEGDILEKFVAYHETSYDDVNNYLDLLVIKKALKDNLDPYRYYVYYYRMLADETKTLDEIGDILHISRERVRQKEAEVNEKLKSIYYKIVKDIRMKYSYAELANLNLTPIEPGLISYMNCLKDNIDEITYFMVYTKYFNSEKANLKYYEHKFSYLSKEKLSDYFYYAANYFKDTNYEAYLLENLKKYSISQIFDFDITPTFTIGYQEVINFLDTITLEDIMFDPYYNELDLASKQLIKKYFYTPSYGEQPNYFYKRTLDSIEREINLYYLGYYKNQDLPLKKEDVENILNNYSEKFDERALTYIRYNYLHDMSLKNHPLAIKKNNNRYDYNKKLYLMKYHLYNFFDNDLYLEQIDKVVKDYPDYITKIEEDILYKYYRDQMSIQSISEIYHMDYIKMHGKIRILREKVLNKFYGLSPDDKDINEEVFITYLNDPCYDFSSDARQILKMYFVEHLNYEEISKKTNYNKTQVSNFVTDGIRKLNFYYYGILKPFGIKEELLLPYLKKSSYTEDEQKMIYDRFVKNIDIEEIGNPMGIKAVTLSHFFGMFYRDFIKDLYGPLTKEDYELELSYPLNESVLNVEERKLIAFKEGIKTSDNPDGKQYSSGELYEIFNLPPSTFGLHKRNIDLLIRERLLGLINPSYGILSKKEIKASLKDPNIPLSDKEKEILCHLYQLDGYPYLDEKDLAKKYQMNKSSLKRRYNRAILSIKQYQNNKKGLQISFDKDILPILKYFSTYDERILRMLYEEKLSIPKIADNLHLTLANTQDIIARLKLNVYEILTDFKSAKKFDFSYARKVLNEPDLPLYDKDKRELYVKLFRMFTGDGEKKKYSSIEINEILNIGTTNPSYLSKHLYDVMLSVIKYREGIRSNEIFSHEEVRNFYHKYQSELTSYEKRVLEDYFNHKATKRMSTIAFYIMLKKENKLVFKIADKTRYEMKKMLMNKSIKLPSITREKIQTYYEISERELMSGKEKRKLVKLIAPFYQKKMLESCKGPRKNKTITLK